MNHSHVGICQICGKSMNLSYEHVPPQHAFNNVRRRMYSGEELRSQILTQDQSPWEYDHMQYIPQQQGAGYFSICEECNNKTGSWYAREYCKWAGTCHNKHLTIARSDMKTPNRQVFFSIEQLDTAISKKVKVKFTYLQYDLNKKLVPRREQKYLVNPYGMVYQNDAYYLVCIKDGTERVSMYRIDRMQDIELTDCALEPRAQGFDSNKVTKQAIYAFSGEPEPVTMLCERSVLDHVIDKFGTNIRIREKDMDKLEIWLMVSPKGVKFWALQYLPYVEVISPQWLRDEIVESVETPKKYGEAMKLSNLTIFFNNLTTKTDDYKYDNYAFDFMIIWPIVSVTKNKEEIQILKEMADRQRTKKIIYLTIKEPWYNPDNMESIVDRIIKLDCENDDPKEYQRILTAYEEDMQRRG